MSLIPIRTFPDPVLRKTASHVDNITDDIVTLSKNMADTMLAARGAGLAANQIGAPTRLIIIDASLNNKKKEHIIIINPTIIESEDEEVGEEGCLSLPQYFEFVKRARKVLARGIDISGKTIELDCDGQLARAMQHEIDHLDGKLFIDHLSPIKKSIFKKKYAGRER